MITTKNEKKINKSVWKIAVALLGDFCRTKETESPPISEEENEKKREVFGARDKKNGSEMGGEKLYV